MIFYFGNFLSVVFKLIFFYLYFNSFHPFLGEVVCYRSFSLGIYPLDCHFSLSKEEKAVFHCFYKNMYTGIYFRHFEYSYKFEALYCIVLLNVAVQCPPKKVYRFNTKDKLT